MDTTNTETNREPSRRTVVKPTLRLVFTGQHAVLPSREIELSHGVTKIGRKVTSLDGIELKYDRRLSSCHVELNVTEDPATDFPFVELRDQGSKNGTFVNGERTARRQLDDGDVVNVGSSLFVFRMEGHKDDNIPEGDLLGKSPVMHKLRQELLRVSASSKSIHLLGESGTGKELAAAALHELRRQRGRAGNLVIVNVAELADGVAESELFGHCAGAFTGARGRADGLFQRANGGTLFLDEIGDLPARQQATLLRAVEQQEVRPVGSNVSQSVDIRLITATNKDLREGVDSKWFRGDLYQRLTGHTVKLPPLRERREDIFQIFEYFYKGSFPAMTASLAHELLLHDYPFNVRELAMLVEDLRLHAKSVERLDLHHIQHRLSCSYARKRPCSPVSRPQPPPETFQAVHREPIPLEGFARNRKQTPSREDLLDLLHRTAGKIDRAARTIGCDHQTVRRWAKLRGIDINQLRLDMESGA